MNTKQVYYNNNIWYIHICEYIFYTSAKKFVTFCRIIQLKQQIVINVLTQKTKKYVYI